MKPPKRDHCRTCRWVEPTGRGRRGTEEVDVGECHGDTPVLTAEGAGAYPPVTLDVSWCRHHEPATPKGKRP